MDRISSLKATRQFSPLILYHKDDSLDHHQRHQNKKQCQPYSINMKARICQHLEETNKMLARNAQLWSIQEDSYATLSEGATSHKKGFVSMILANETTTDQNENDMNSIIPSSSASSTLSNSSTDSGDSITIITTPVCPTKSIPMSSLVITPPLPLYHQPNIYNKSDLCQNDDQYYRHFHQPLSSFFQESKESSSSSPRYVARSVSPNQPTVHTGFVAPFTSSPHYSRSVATKTADALEYFNKTTRVAELLSPPTSTSSPLSSPSFTQPSGKKKGMTGLGIKKRRRQNLSKRVTELLKCWLLQHKEHPYPTERQKLELAQRTDLGVNQISNWFINARRRILHPMIETEQQLLAQQQQHEQQQQYMYMTHSSYGNRYQQSRYYSSTKSPSIPLYNNEEGKQQNIYAASYGPDELPHDIQHWSVPQAKLPTIEIPRKDQQLFSTVP